MVEAGVVVEVVAGGNSVVVFVTVVRGVGLVMVEVVDVPVDE